MENTGPAGRRTKTGRRHRAAFMTETEERLRLVADVVKADLEERFAGKVAFDPIVVAPARSVYGDDYFRVIVVVPDGTALEPAPAEQVQLPRLGHAL